MHPTDPARCGRKTRYGLACASYAMHGQTVCRMHGGSSPQAKRSAEERMRALIHPAVSALARQIENNEFQATKFVLEWAGFRQALEVKTDAEITIRVVREEQPIIVGMRALDGDG